MIWRPSAARVVGQVFGDAGRLKFVWTRLRCTQRYDDEKREPYYPKDLKKVKRRGFDLSRVLMLDDSPEKVHRNYGNHLWIRPFEGQPDDRELLDLLPFLQWLKDQPNFRTIEKRDRRARRRP